MKLDIEVPWYQQAWAWLKTHWYLPVTISVGLIFWLASLLLSKRGVATPTLLQTVDAEIRVSRHKADAEIEARRVATESAIREVEAKHTEAIAALTNQQNSDYEEVRRKGPKATAAWLNDFSKSRGL